MTPKNLDKFSILIAIIAVAVTVSIMSLTGKMERGEDDTLPVADTVVVAPADTVSAPGDSISLRPVADTLDAYI